MRPDPIPFLCALTCLWSSVALATPDPFDTEAMLQQGVPCAQAMPDGALNLLNIVNLALCNNPQTREVWAAARVQAAQVGVSRASYLPSPSLTVSENRSRVNAAPSVYQRNIGLNISYLLYDFGARAANLENARHLLEAAIATQDSTVQAVFLQAVQFFYQTQSTQASLVAATEAERAAKESFAAAQARYVNGSATPADKLQAQTAYSQATLNRIGAEGSMKNARGALANMLGLDANREVLLVAGTVVELDKGYVAQEQRLKIFGRDVAALIEEARLKRPDLYAATAALKAAQANVDAVRAAGMPSVYLSASTNQSNSAGQVSRGTSTGVTLNVPIFSGFAPTYRIRAAQAQAETKSAQLERLRLQVSLDVWTAYQNLTTATQSLRSSADLQDSATQSEQVALGRYKAGVGSMLDVLNAQSALANARQQRIQATFNWNIGRAQLAQAMGGLDTELLQELPGSTPNSKPSIK